MKQFRNLFTFIIGIGLILTMGACTPTVEPADTQSAQETPTAQPEKPTADILDLDGSIWDLHSFDGADKSENGITLQLAEGIVSGSDGCNRFSNG